MELSKAYNYGVEDGRVLERENIIKYILKYSNSKVEDLVKDIIDKKHINK